MIKLYVLLLGDLTYHEYTPLCNLLFISVVGTYWYLLFVLFLLSPYTLPAQALLLKLFSVKKKKICPTNNALNFLHQARLKSFTIHLIRICCDLIISII